jgi:hypothetical protein
MRLFRTKKDSSTGSFAPSPGLPTTPAYPPPPTWSTTTPPGGVMGAAGSAGAPSGVESLLEDRPAQPRSESKVPVRERLVKLGSALDGVGRPPLQFLSKLGIRWWMNALGMTAIGFGIVTIILGWYGSSHSPYLQQEIPYLISGGLLGVGLIIGGGVLVLSSWHLRTIQEANRNAQALVRSLDRVERVMRATMNGAATQKEESAPYGSPPVSSGSSSGT